MVTATKETLPAFQKCNRMGSFQQTKEPECPRSSRTYGGHLVQLPLHAPARETTLSIRSMHACIWLQQPKRLFQRSRNATEWVHFNRRWSVNAPEAREPMGVTWFNYPCTHQHAKQRCPLGACMLVYGYSNQRDSSSVPEMQPNGFISTDDGA